MNKLAPLLLLTFFAALPQLHPSAGSCLFTAGLPGPRAVVQPLLPHEALQGLGAHIPAGSRLAAVRGLARMLRTYVEAAPQEQRQLPAAVGPYPRNA